MFIESKIKFWQKIQIEDLDSNAEDLVLVLDSVAQDSDSVSDLGGSSGCTTGGQWGIFLQNIFFSPFAPQITTNVLESVKIWQFWHKNGKRSKFFCMLHMHFFTLFTRNFSLVPLCPPPKFWCWCCHSVGLANWWYGCCVDNCAKLI